MFDLSISPYDLQNIRTCLFNQNNIVKVPYCANEGKNYSQVYSNGEFLGEPIKENLDLRLGQTRNLYDWLFDFGSK